MKSATLLHPKSAPSQITEPQEAVDLGCDQVNCWDRGCPAGNEREARKLVWMLLLKGFAPAARLRVDARGPSKSLDRNLLQFYPP